MNNSTIDKLLKLNYDLYEHEARDFSDTRHEIWEKPVIDFVKEINPCSSILDLGCGNARLLQLLNKNLQKKRLKTNNRHSHILANLRMCYLGIDISKELIKLNRRKYHDAQFRVGDSLNLKYHNKFDYVISLAVLHHIPSKELQLKFLKKIRHSLKANGQLLISVWNRQQIKFKNLNLKTKNQNLKLKTFASIYQDLEKDDTIVPWRQSGYFRYIHAFTTKELKNLAQKAGFKNIQCYYADKYGKSNINDGLNIYLRGEK